jgi:drug/metabolite transporter (DMT)-like permease
MLFPLFLGLVWASAFPLVALALAGGTEPLWLVAIRLSLGALFIYAVCVYKQVAVLPSLKEWRKLMPQSLIANTIPFSLISFGQQQIPASITAMIIAGVPILVVVFDTVIHRTLVSKTRLLAILLGTTGVVIALSPERQVGGSSSIDFLHLLAVMGAAVCYALTHSLGYRLAGLDILPKSFWMNAMAGVVSIILGLMYDGGANLSIIAPQGWLSLLLLAVFPTALATMLFFRALKMGGTALTALAGNMVPIFGVLLSVALVGETLHLEVLLGGGLVVLALYMVRRSRKIAA